MRRAIGELEERERWSEGCPLVAVIIRKAFCEVELRKDVGTRVYDYGQGEKNDDQPLHR